MYNAKIEIELVGVVLAHPDHYKRAATIAASDFNDRGLGRLWEIFGEMNLKGIPLSQANLSLHYGREIQGMGGDVFLGTLASQGAGIVTEIDKVIECFQENALWRKLGSIAAHLTKTVESQDRAPGEVLSSLIDHASKILAASGDATESKSEVVQRMIEKAKTPRELITTGIDSLDFLMQGGLQPTRLYGIGGLFGRGKTVLLGTVSENLNMQDVPHLFISMETPPEDIEARHAARHMNINASSLLDPNDPDFDRFCELTEKYSAEAKNNTRYDYCPGATISEIHRKILAAKARYGCQGVIIDYWQLIEGRERGVSLEQHRANVANRLATICRQENIWIVTAAQVDERGKLVDSQSLLRATSLYVLIERDVNDMAMNFVTEKSNYTRYADTTGESTPQVVFDNEVGPYVRNTNPLDMPALAEESEGRLMI